MTRAKTAIVALGVLLIGSNLWWAYRLLDAGVSYTYLGVSVDDNRAALAQILAIVPIVARGDATPTAVIAAALEAGSGGKPFEKDGFIWVGHIGLRFGPDGRLQEVSRAWSPP